MTTASETGDVLPFLKRHGGIKKAENPPSKKQGLKTSVTVAQAEWA
jgi:hypothetical protein